MAEGWTVAEAATLLDPPMTEDQVRAMIRAFDLRPVGKRSTGPHRPAAVYPVRALSECHAAVMRHRHEQGAQT